MATIEQRIEALEQRIAAVELPISEPFWSEAHGCMMVNHGGFILPAILGHEEWEQAAMEQQATLTKK